MGLLPVGGIRNCSIFVVGPGKKSFGTAPGKSFLPSTLFTTAMKINSCTKVEGLKIGKIFPSSLKRRQKQPTEPAKKENHEDI